MQIITTEFVGNGQEAKILLKKADANSIIEGLELKEKQIDKKNKKKIVREREIESKEMKHIRTLITQFKAIRNLN